MLAGNVYISLRACLFFCGCQYFFVLRPYDQDGPRVGIPCMSEIPLIGGPLQNASQDPAISGGRARFCRIRAPFKIFYTHRNSKFPFVEIRNCWPPRVRAHPHLCAEGSASERRSSKRIAEKRSVQCRNSPWAAGPYDAQTASLRNAGRLAVPKTDPCSAAQCFFSVRKSACASRMSTHVSKSRRSTALTE